MKSAYTVYLKMNTSGYNRQLKTLKNSGFRVGILFADLIIEIVNTFINTIQGGNLWKS